MITKTTLLVALVAAPAIQAQQASTPTSQHPPAAAPAAQVKPCSPSKIANPAKHTRFHLPPKLQAQLEKQRQKIAQNSGVDVDINGAINETITTPTPCPAAVTPRTETK